MRNLSPLATNLAAQLTRNTVLGLELFFFFFGQVVIVTEALSRPKQTKTCLFVFLFVLFCPLGASVHSQDFCVPIYLIG